jgi:hypothetical protein
VSYQPPPSYYPQGQYGGGWRPEAPRPGCIPLRPLGASDILDGSFKVIRRNPRTMLGASALVSVVQVAISTVVQLVALNQIGQVKIDRSDGSGSTDLGPLLGGELTTFAGLLIRLVIGSVLTGVLVVTVTQDVLGIQLTPRQAWDRVRPRVGALIALSFLTGVIEFLGLIPLFVLGIWLWGIWAVAVPALIIENTTIRGAWGRSKQLVDGTFWRVWGIRALGWLLVTVITGVITLPFEVIGLLVSGADFGDLANGHQPVALVLFVAIGALIANTFTAPVLAGIESLIYVDLRMRKEGLDIVLQQRAAGSAR